MHNRLWWLLPLAFFGAVWLGGCGKSEEGKRQEAQAELAQGREQYNRNQLAEAETTLQRVAEKYPQTEQAKEAAAWLDAIPGKRENDLRLACYEVLGRLRDILDGYRAVYGNLPASFQEIDASDYFFDSDYLAGVVPADFTVYLVFRGRQGYQVWGVRQGEEHGYLYDSEPAGFRRFDDPAEVKKLESDATAVRIGNLIGIAGRAKS